MNIFPISIKEISGKKMKTHYSLNYIQLNEIYCKNT